MITLFQFPSCWGLPNFSPFCMKVETYLRMVNLPFEIKTTANLSRAPKGKLPFIKDGDKIIADTSLIFDYLKKQYGDSLDAQLSEMQRAQGLALQRLFEEHLYWIALYSRWVDPNNWPIVRETIFQSVPRLLRNFIARKVQKKMIAELHHQGLGRHTQEEIYQFGLADLKAINVFLKQHPFLLGDEPSSFDAIGYAFLANLVYPPLHSPLSEYAKSQKNIFNYCENIKKRYYTKN